MSEPRTITAGASATWTRYLPDYPAGSYTLAYSLRLMTGTSPAAVFEAVADGVASHKVALLPAQTLGLDPGTYSLVGYVSDDETAGATVREIVFDGTVQVLPNPLGGGAGDRRTHARRMVDLLRAALEKLAGGTTSQVTVQGKSWTQRSLGELRAELARYEEQVRQEEAAARGQTGSGNIFVRFGSTSL